MNSGGFEVKTSDPGKSGKEKLGLDSSNGSAQMAANVFEKRCTGNEGAAH